MPRTTMTCQTPPAEGFYASDLPTLHAQPVRTFRPTGSEANYRSPLVVILQCTGSSAAAPSPAPSFRSQQSRQPRVFTAPGNKSRVPPPDPRRRDFRLLYGAGVDVELHTYAIGNTVHPYMFRDINRWIMKKV